MQNNFHTSEHNMTTGQGFVIGALSGAMTVITAGADCFALVNLNSAPLAVTKVRVRWATTTAFGSAQALIFSFFKVYAFTAIHTGGTGTAVRAHYMHQASVTKDRAGTAVTTGDRIPAVEVSAMISGTAAITGATYTAPDADEPEFVAVGAGSTLPGVYEDYERPDGVPLVLPLNTGLIGRVGLTMGATGVGNLFVGVDGFRMLT